MLALMLQRVDTQATVKDPKLYKHPHPDSITNGFLEDARVVYGDEGAHIIGSALIGYASGALATFPFVERNSTQLLLGVVEPPPGHANGASVKAWSLAHRNRIALMFSPTASIEEIVEDLRYAIPHELGHIAHYQNNPNFDQDAKKIGQYFFFQLAISEGIADWAAGARIDKQSAQKTSEDSYSLKQELISLLNAKRDADISSYDFLYGNVENLSRPYEVGNYVVSALATSRNYNMSALMKAPLGEYVDFARSELT